MKQTQFTNQTHAAINKAATNLSTEPERITALVIALDLPNDEIEDIEDTGIENEFHANGSDYLVLTDDEADEAVKDYVRESLWAFNSSFLAEQTGLPEEVFTALQPQCEGANEAIFHILEGRDGLDLFVEEAVSADGRGHFLSGYDGHEMESGDYFIYRTN